MKMSDDREGFERSWEKAFENAEITPPGTVWKSIDAKLAASEKKGKRRFLLIKLAVAASMVFALSLTFYNVLWNDQKISHLTLDEDRHEIKGQSSDEGSLESGDVMDSDDKRIEIESSGDLQRATGSAPEIKPFSSGSSLAEKEFHAHTRDNRAQKGLNEFGNAEVSGENIQMIGMEEREAPVVNETSEFNPNNKMLVALLNKEGLAEIAIKPGEVVEIEVYPLGYDLISPNRGRKDEKNNVFIAGLNFSAGSFDQGVSASGSQALQNTGDGLVVSSSSRTFNEYAYSLNSVNNSFNISEKETYKQSVAYSYGANIGYKVTRRLVIFSGVNYVKANSRLNTSLSITENGNRVADAIVTNKAGNMLNIGESGNGEVNVNNLFEFASIPVKAGYMIFDEKLNLTVLAGVSTEFLLNSSNSSEETSGAFLEHALDTSSDDEYNSVYFNGIVGLNLGYTFFERYRLSVEPTIRKSLNSFSESSTEVSRPLYKLIQFGVSYQF